MTRWAGMCCAAARLDVARFSSTREGQYTAWVVVPRIAVDIIVTASLPCWVVLSCCVALPCWVVLDSSFRQMRTATVIDVG